MTDGLFGDLDLENAKENPFYKEDDTYRCLLTAAPIKTSKAGNKGMELTFTVQEGEHRTEKIIMWNTVPYPYQLQGYPSKQDMENQTNYDEDISRKARISEGFLKKTLLSLGFTNEELSTVTQKDILAVGYVDVTIRHDDKGNEKITGIALVKDDEESSPFDSSLG